MISRSCGMSKGASLAPQLTKIDLAVLPVTSCQGFFNHAIPTHDKIGISTNSPKQKSAVKLHKNLTALCVFGAFWIYEAMRKIAFFPVHFNGARLWI